LIRRILRFCLWTLAAIVGLVVLAVAAVFIVPNTGPGASLLARTITSVTGGQVVVQGISGRSPDALRVAHIELHDSSGTWLAIDDAALDWSPTALLHGTAEIDRLTAAHVVVARLPQSAPATPGTGKSAPFSLPVQVDLRQLHVARLELAAPVAGAPAVLRVDVKAHLATLTAGNADITIDRVDGAGHYHLDGMLDAARLTATLRASEPAHGLVSGLAGLPDLGAIAVQADIDGPWSAAVTRLAVTAGPLRAGAHGVVDITGQSATLDVAASAPAMAPRPDVSWQSVALAAHVTGPFTRPRATGTLRLAGLAVAGARLDSLTADLNGDAAGHVAVVASLAGLHLPGPQPDIFAVAPMQIRAQANLAAADRPVTLAITHPLLSLNGTLDAGAAPAADLALTLPDLSAFPGGLQGHTTLHLAATRTDATTRLDVTGDVGITGGPAPAPVLIGPAATVALAATMTGGDISITRLALTGAQFSASAHGGLIGGKLDLAAVVTLPDLAALAPGVQGSLTATSRVTGPTGDFALTTDLAGSIATPGFPRTPLAVRIAAGGLPAAPAGTVTASATLAGAPLALEAAVQRLADGTLHLAVSKADWKTAHLDADVTLPPGAAVPQGHLALRMADLAQLRPFLGPASGGDVTLTANIDAQHAAHLTMRTRNVGPTGTIALQGDGPADALALKLAVTGAGIAAGTDATAAATLDMPARRLAVASLHVTGRGQTVALLAPATLSFADGLAVDRLRLGLQNAVIQLAGRLSPTLDVTASIRNLPASLAALASPGLLATGVLQADAHLTGNPAQPNGTMRLTATGLHLRQGPASALPPATITASAALVGGRARVATRLALGASSLAITGTAPLAATGPFNLHGAGTVDLAMLNPLLAGSGRHVLGRLALDTTLTGTVAAPRLAGSVRLAGGDVQDFSQGVHIHDISALIRATGDTIRIASFTGRAGAGTIGLTGQIGIAAPMPVDLHVIAHNASPLASDLLTAVLSTDLTLRGDVQGAMALSGGVTISRAEIRVPEKLPASVAVLNVLRPGQKPPPPPAPAPNIALDVTVKAPSQVFIRGRGLDAELQGSLHVGGTAAAPRPSGGFTLRRGQFSIAGQTLNFTRGIVSLDGSGRIDPTLDFIASTTAGSVTANLAITGYADAPKIALSSTPELPQDEVLARLLFGQSVAKLGPLQLAEMAAALAEITGVTSGSGLGALDSVRQGLGLDRLTVGGGSGGSGANVEAGRYVAQGVYVGAKQATSGGGSQAVVQIDLFHGLKLQTTVGTGGGASSATGSADSSGTSVGLTYQFEY
jgi:translocation and assembly module TamB